MTTITLEIPEERVQQLRERAERLGITLEDLLHMSISDITALPDADFQRVMSYVLEKNADLYRRLA